MKDIHKKIRYYFIEAGQIPPITKAQFQIRANYLKEMNLDLTLKKEWFDMIALGEKKEEYLEVKPYRISRMTNGLTSLERNWRGDQMHIFPKIVQNLKKFETITFRNGYQKYAPTIVKEIESISIDNGNPKWGAIEGQYYFVIKLK